MTEPNVRDEILFSRAKLKLEFEIWSDGTNTTANIRDRQQGGKIVGQGFARRRKGDSRDQGLGDQLALSRAFTDLAGLVLTAGLEEVE